MIKRKSVYIGGETDSQDLIIPKYYEDFFKESLLFFVTGLILLLLILLFI
tara:strand:- start:4991 stop:5140 length:150 start_codon:yes stop_codon:yes gene_type:complete